MVLVSDSWKSLAASAGERAVPRSIAGHSASKLAFGLRSVCRTSPLGMLLVSAEESGRDDLRPPADWAGLDDVRVLDTSR